MDVADIRDRRLAMLDGGWQPIAVHAPWSPYAHDPGKQPVKRWGETPSERIGDAGIAKPNSPA